MSEALVKSEGAPLPVFSGAQMTQALTAYRELQKALDASMPDQIMELDGRPFRKKGYWRAVAVAFNLTVEIVSEHYEERGVFEDGRPNFGYTFECRATAPNGRTASGDGACFAVEKAKRFEFVDGKKVPVNPWASLPLQATDHNVRGHAHTRAYNRAISNLCGFGEVSAEEVERDEHAPAGRSSSAPPAPAVAADGNTTVTDVSTRQGKSKNGKTWTLYTVTCADGRKGTTFDSHLADEALEYKEHGRVVHPEFETTAKGTNLVGFSAVPSAGAVIDAETVAEPDEPVNGPEKILTIRNVATVDGSRWVIQTEKRQVVTADEKIAQMLETVKAEGKRIVPTFEVVTKNGKSANRLIEFGVES